MPSATPHDLHPAWLRDTSPVPMHVLPCSDHGPIASMAPAQPMAKKG